MVADRGPEPVPEDDGRRRARAAGAAHAGPGAGGRGGRAAGRPAGPGAGLRGGRAGGARAAEQRGRPRAAGAGQLGAQLVRGHVLRRLRVQRQGPAHGECDTHKPGAIMMTRLQAVFSVTR